MNGRRSRALTAGLLALALLLAAGWLGRCIARDAAAADRTRALEAECQRTTTAGNAARERPDFDGEVWAARLEDLLRRIEVHSIAPDKHETLLQAYQACLLRRWSPATSRTRMEPYLAGLRQRFWATSSALPLSAATRERWVEENRVYARVLRCVMQSRGETADDDREALAVAREAERRLPELAVGGAALQLLGDVRGMRGWAAGRLYARGAAAEARAAFADNVQLIQRGVGAICGRGHHMAAHDWVAVSIVELEGYPAAWRAEAAWALREALKRQSEAARVANRPEPWAEALHLLAVADYEGVKQGVSDMDAALFSAQRAMTAAEQAPGDLGRDLQTRAAALVGVVGESSGDFAAALPGWERSAELAARDQVHDAWKRQAQARAGIAESQMALGRFEEARTALPGADEVFSEHTDPSEYSTWPPLDGVYATMARLHLELGEADAAAQAYEAALTHAPGNDRSVIYQLALADLALSNGKRAEALSLLGASEHRLGDPDPWLDQTACEAQARRLEMQGNLRGALVAWRGALAAARQCGNRSDEALIHLATGDFLLRFPEGPGGSAATKEFEEALQYALAYGHRAIEWQARFGLGRAAELQGKEPEALRHYGEARRVIERLRQVNGGACDVAARLLPDAGDVYRCAIALLLRRGESEQAFVWCRAYEGQVLRQQLAGAAETGQASGALPQAAAAAKTAHGQLGMLASRALDLAPGAARDALRISLQTARDRYRTAAACFASLRDTLPAPADPLIPTRELAAMARKERLTLASFLVQPSEVTSFVVDPHGLHVVHSRALSGEHLKRAALCLERECSRKPMMAFQATRAYRESARLYRALIAPLKPFLIPDRPLVVVPDEPLQDVPFNALVVDPASGRQMVQEREVVPQPSLDVYYGQFRRPRTPGKAVVLACGYGQAASPPAASLRGGFGPLLHAAEEGRAVARELGATLRLDDGVNRNTFRAALRSKVAWLIVHVAYDRRDAVSPALMFPGPHGLERLGLRDLLQAPPDSSNALELVTLAGCSTAQGAAGAGDGRISLAWAFQRLGAHSVVAAGWALNDAAGSQLMQAFARNLKTMERAEALRAAQRQLLANPAYRHPYYWAGVTLSGRTDAIGPLEPASPADRRPR